MEQDACCNNIIRKQKEGDRLLFLCLVSPEEKDDEGGVLPGKRQKNERADEIEGRMQEDETVCGRRKDRRGECKERYRQRKEQKRASEIQNEVCHGGHLSFTRCGGADEDRRETRADVVAVDDLAG